MKELTWLFSCTHLMVFDPCIRPDYSHFGSPRFQEPTLKHKDTAAVLEMAIIYFMRKQPTLVFQNEEVVSLVQTYSSCDQHRRKLLLCLNAAPQRISSAPSCWRDKAGRAETLHVVGMGWEMVFSSPSLCCAALKRNHLSREASLLV